MKILLEKRGSFIKKRKIKLIVSGMLCVALLILCAQMSVYVAAAEESGQIQETTAQISSDLNVEKVSEKIQGTINVERLSSGTIAYVYVPDNTYYGVRASATPILLVYGNEAYTPEVALETAYRPGLAAIADVEQGAVVFINPLGEAWGEEDISSLEAAKKLFSDSTDNEKK